MSDIDVDTAILALRDYRLRGGRATVRDSARRPDKPGRVTVTFELESNELYYPLWRRAAYRLMTGKRRPPGYV